MAPRRPALHDAGIGPWGFGDRAVERGEAAPALRAEHAVDTLIAVVSGGIGLPQGIGGLRLNSSVALPSGSMKMVVSASAE